MLAPVVPLQQKQQYPLFDMAYQGFASGDTERDAESIRIFLADGHQIAVGQSFAKNMGLYGQRIGCLRWGPRVPRRNQARGPFSVFAIKITLSSGRIAVAKGGSSFLAHTSPHVGLGSAPLRFVAGVPDCPL
jgi:histidinol-phosphate/aromatic aminotransferase/cobyric acid decarboxylase-like protein